MKYLGKHIARRKSTSYPFLLFLLLSLPFGVFASGQPGSSAAPDACPLPGQQPASSQAFPLPKGARLSERLFGLTGLNNVGRIAPGIYRGAQPAPGGYATLKKMGIRTVINLRTTETEKKKVEAAGMRSVEIPVGMFNNGDRKKLDKVVAIMADPANRPVFVHCRQGQDRTGIVVAAYRMKIDGWPLSLAEAEMESFGFNDVWVNFRRFLHRYAAELDKAKGTVKKK
jgi:protein tyrosine/serine phosphatase